MKPCDCGCGKLIRNANRFVLGHQLKKKRLCKCGCGREVSGHYMPGHKSQPQPRPATLKKRGFEAKDVFWEDDLGHLYLFTSKTDNKRLVAPFIQHWQKFAYSELRGKTPVSMTRECEEEFCLSPEHFDIVLAQE